MKLVQVKDNQIVQYNLPKVGKLQDCSSVSGYDILMNSDLELAKREGWLPLEDNPPLYNEDTQYLIHDGYEILEDKVVVKYKVEDIIIEDIPQELSEVEKIRLEQAQSNVEMIELIMLLQGGI